VREQTTKAIRQRAMISAKEGRHVNTFTSHDSLTNANFDEEQGTEVIAIVDVNSSYYFHVTGSYLL
jgi:hypothetical protein